MGIKCPLHNADLIIEHTKLTLFQCEHPVVVGECPVCRTHYINQVLLSANGSVIIDKKRYIYLDALSVAYPAEKVEIQVKESPKVHIPQDKEKQRIEAQQRRQKELQEKRRKEEELAAKREKENEERANAAREAAILETRQQNAQGMKKAYHVKKIRYMPYFPKCCPDDGEQLDYVDNIHFATLSKAVRRSSWCCFRCRTAFFLESEREEITKKMNQAQIATINRMKTKPFLQTSSPSSEERNFAIRENTLYVCKGTIACKRDGHKLEAATGILLGKNDIAIKVNTNYCPQCRKYFIGHDEYVRYRQIYGVLLGNLKVTNGSFVQSETDLADESILHMCGYSVNQADNLTAAERQGILQYLIDSKVSSKPEIIEYLNFFIRRNGKRQNMEEAVRRWNEDLKWVREYQINRQRFFEISKIQKNI